jgi:hypothetical protein
VLLGALAIGITPGRFVSLAVPLFLLPEAIGLLRKGDSLPPLTYVIRRYIPRWCVYPIVWSFGAWGAISWSSLKPQAYRNLVWLALAFVVGWLNEHFDVTYDSPGE